METTIDTNTAPQKRQITLKSVLGFILLVALAAVFFFSAYAKVHSDNAFDSFQWTFYDLGIKSQLFAGILARLMIGLELLLGLFLLLHIFLRQFTYKAIMALLGVFIVYLLLVIWRQGNAGNCGCFGDKLAMTPGAAILKNVAMMAVTAILMAIYRVKPYKNQDMLSLIIGMTALTVPFIINPLNVSSAPVRFNREVNLDLLYQYQTVPKVELRKGKHIVAFMTLTCPHCKKAAYLLQIIHREHPEIPVYMVLSGEDKDRQAFFNETHANDVPYLLYYHWPEFTSLVGEDGYPAIYWINNGKVEYKSVMTYYQLDPRYMAEWAAKH